MPTITIKKPFKTQATIKPYMKWKILDNMSTMECIEPQTNEELKKKFINLHTVHCALFTVALGYSRDTKIRNSCLVSIIENLFKNHCSLQFEKKR